MNFYFTFGFLSPHSGKYLQVKATSWSDAHNIAMQRYGHYQYQYTAEEFARVMNQYPNLELLEEI